MRLARRSKGLFRIMPALRRETRNRFEAPVPRGALRARCLAVSLVGRNGPQGQCAWPFCRALLLGGAISQCCQRRCTFAQGGILFLIGANGCWLVCIAAALFGHFLLGRCLCDCFGCWMASLC